MRTARANILDAVEIAAAQPSGQFTLEHLEHWSLITKNTDNQATAKTFTADAGTDTFTAASAHGLATGQIVQVSTTGGLPAGLSAATDYYVIDVDGTDFQLATTLANAIAGTAIDITSAGTGTHTETPAAWGVTLKAQYSNAAADLDETIPDADWIDMPSGSLTLDSGATPANKTLAASNVGYRWIRFVLTVTGGGGTLTAYFAAKGAN